MNEKVVRLYNTITNIDDDLIEKASKPFKQKKKRIALKVILTAAAITALLVAGLSVYAGSNNTKIPYTILRIVNGEADENYDLFKDGRRADAQTYAFSETAVAKELAAHGISPVTLPAFFDNSKIKTERADYDGEYGTMLGVSLDFSTEDFKGCLSIDKYFNEIEGVTSATHYNVKNGEIVDANGMDIIVLDQDGMCSIEYRDKLTYYNIYLYNIDYEKAVEFAKTIK